MSVTVNGDLLDEANETYFVNLTAPVNATIADGQGRGRSPTTTRRRRSRSTTLPSPKATAARPARRSPSSLSAASGRTVTVNYATADGTAIAPADYVSANGSLYFPPGRRRGQLSVTVNGDTLDEIDETYFVNLSAPANATIADGQGLGTIIDNDGPSISIDDVTVTEGDWGR